jgi:hypothetical protein
MNWYIEPSRRTWSVSRYILFRRCPSGGLWETLMRKGMISTIVLFLLWPSVATALRCEALAMWPEDRKPTRVW